MKDDNEISSKFTYKRFVEYMQRYEKDKKRKSLKEKHNNPYKYTRVFNKDKDK